MWKVDGVVLKPGPTEFSQNPNKQVTVSKTIDNKDVRVMPENNVKNALDLRWDSIGAEWRNRFYEYFINDTVFTIQSHLYNENNPWQIWTVRVSSFNSLPKQTGERWQLQLGLEEV